MFTELLSVASAWAFELRKAISLNAGLLKHVARAWVKDFDFQGQPRTCPLKPLQQQVALVSLLAAC